MVDRAHDLTDKELERMERQLTAIYARAEKELAEKAEKYFARFAEADAAKRKLVEAGELTEQAYKDWRQRKMMTGKHWTQMQEQVARQLHRVNVTANEYVEGKLPKVYALNYNETAGVIEVGTQQAISFELINEDAVKYMAQNIDRNLLPHKQLDPVKDIPWNMQQVNSEILQGLVQGESIPQMADRLVKNVGIRNRDSAIRAARTLVTQTENQARYDCAKAAEEKGVIMKKEWIATRDERTRDAHLEAWAKYGTRDKAIPIDEPFEVGGEELMEAGDPSGSPWNVYNCRCTNPHIPAGFKSILPPEKRGSIKVRWLDEDIGG